MICRSVMSAVVLSVLTAWPAAGQNSGWAAQDEAGVRAAAMDYMEGALNADGDRVGRGVHPELNKVLVVTLPGGEGQVLSYNTCTTLVEAVRGMGDRVANIPKDVEVTVFDIDGDLAVARAVGAPWYDYAQLARINGEWRIVNVLWAQNQPSAESEGSNGREDWAAVEAAARDYIEGSYAGTPERMERALHPELHKVRLVTHPETGVQFLQKMGYSALVEGTRAGMGMLPEGEWGVEVDIFDVSHDMAMAKVTSARYIDYVQLAKVNGAWKLINVLWVPNPEAQG